MDAVLVLFGKNGQRKRIAIKAGMTTLGRRPDCQVRIPLPIVSRTHCRISNKDNRLVIQDLGSANGTFVNDRQITESEIKAGDRIKIGTMDFLIQIDGQPKNISPVDQTANRKQASGSSTSELSDSHVTSGPTSTKDALSDLDLSADAGLDDSFS